jgi:hypothetical protein
MTRSEFETNLKKVGKRFEDITKKSLLDNYRYSFGFNKDAYSRGRNPQFKGQGPKVDTGSLYNSVEWVSRRINDNEYELGLLMNFYWEWVDRGRGPGFGMPIGTLMDWYGRKFGISDEKTKLGYAIATNKNIKEYGIEGTQFFSRIASTKFIDELADEIETLLGISIDDFFNALDVENINQVQVRLF